MEMLGWGSGGGVHSPYVSTIPLLWLKYVFGGSYKSYTNPLWHLPKRVQAGVASQEMFQEIEDLNHWGIRNIKFDSIGANKDTI